MVEVERLRKRKKRSDSGSPDGEPQGGATFLSPGKPGGEFFSDRQEWRGITMVAVGHADAGMRERVRHAMPLH
jgi:hypothetical protein